MQVRNTIITIRGKNATSCEAVYDEIGRQIPLPPHFGRNLDALWDVLSTDIPGPLTVIWKDSSLSRAAMGDDFVRIRGLLEELSRERDDVFLRFDP